MSRSVWLVGWPARDVTSACIIWPVCLCVCVHVRDWGETDAEWHEAKPLSSPYKIFTRPVLATVSGGGGEGLI